MAGDPADLFDHQVDHVGVAVQAQFVQLLHMPDSSPLRPASPRTRPIDCTVLAGGQASASRFIQAIISTRPVS